MARLGNTADTCSNPKCLTQQNDSSVIVDNTNNFKLKFIQSRRLQLFLKPSA